jgi:hypothetical protein
MAGTVGAAMLFRTAVADATALHRGTYLAPTFSIPFNTDRGRQHDRLVLFASSGIWPQFREGLGIG